MTKHAAHNAVEERINEELKTNMRLPSAGISNPMSDSQCGTQQAINTIVMINNTDTLCMFNLEL